jgi:carbamoyltransferase
MYILGLRADGYDTSCALMKDGKIVCAICEERLTREKRTKRFPINAVKYCLEYEKISINDIDHVVVPWNPGINLERMFTAHSEIHRFMPEMLYSIPNYLIGISDEPTTEIEQAIKFGKRDIRVHYLNHHLCHSALPYYTSGFGKALILSMDAWGEKTSTLLGMADKGRIEKLWEIEFPNSLGMFYQTMTEYLGFSPQGDEWKVMGAASYGNKDRYKDKILQLIYPTNDGKFEVNLSFFDYMSFTKKYHFSDKMVNLLGPKRSKKEELTERHIDIASAVQHVFEEIIFHILNKSRAGSIENLCLSGGSAMNCVANGKIPERTRLKNVSISFAPDDAGSSIGACFFYWYNNVAKFNPSGKKLLSPYLSKDYDDREIKSALDDFKIVYKEVKDPVRTAAELIARGEIVGWFQGKMEFGQRALGNRSILADPRVKEMKDRINNAVKFRESFRPFAPSILDEYGDEYFKRYEFIPYMEKVLYFKKGKGKAVPAVCHVDGTGRLQSVSKRLNPLFWELIDEFRKITGIPMVLNTSFNLNGEPIVHSVKDALRTFYSCGLDILIVGRYLIRKNGGKR